MHCPNCGRELAEGEVCNCAPTTEQQTTQQAPTQQTYYTPQPPTGTQGVSGAAAPGTQQTYYPAPVAGVPVKARTDYPEGYKPTKKLVAVILALTLGMFGIHNFYLGYRSRATAQLLICLIGSLAAGLGLVVAYVWAFVEAVQLFVETSDKDANGYKILTLEESIARAIVQENSKQ